MPIITKAARAATLEAAGVTEKIEALRRELGAAIQRAEDHMREDVAALRDEMRENVAGIRDEMRGNVAGLRDDMRGLRAEVANDRRAMLEIVDGLRCDSAADRQAMLALLASTVQPTNPASPDVDTAP